MAEFRSARRYYLGKRKVAAAACDEMQLIWRAKQEAEPGTLLSNDFPHHARLEAAGYTTDTDLDGADVEELITAGFTRREAEAVLAAFESLP